MKNYKCKLCGDVRTSQKATIMHIRRKHSQVKNPRVNEHYKLTTAKPKTAKTKNQQWRKWAKYPDGSRKFKLVNGKWKIQKPGTHFLNSDKKKLSIPDNMPQILGLDGQPQIHSDGIIINVLVKIPLSFGMPVIIPPEV